MKQFRAWAIGLLNAVLDGAAAAVASFAVGVSTSQAWKIAAFSAVVGGAKWMSQHPVPGGENGTTSSST